MRNKFIELCKNSVLRFAALSSRCVMSITRKVREVIYRTCFTVGLVVLGLLLYAARVESYAITFDYYPLVLSVEPRSRIEQRVREADQEREAELKMNAKNKQ